MNTVFAAVLNCESKQCGCKETLDIENRESGESREIVDTETGASWISREKVDAEIGKSKKPWRKGGEFLELHIHVHHLNL